MPGKKKAQRKASVVRSKRNSPKAEGGPDGLPVLELAGAQPWQRWLTRNHGASRGVWLAFAKKDSGRTSITYPEAVEAALCWGWIDGQAHKRDASSWLQRFSPRGARSVWSKINRDKALSLIERGAMQPPGLAEVERAKRDGRWERAYDSPRNAQVPDDFKAALAAEPRAAQFFETLNAANRYAIWFRLHHAKRPETRARRIAQFVAMLARGKKLHS